MITTESAADTPMSGDEGRQRWQALIEVLPGFLVIGLFIVWTPSEGGFLETSWYPGALFTLGLLLTTAVVQRRQGNRLPRAALLPLGLLAAFTVWSFLSIAWADNAAIAWEGANRTLAYLLVFSVFIALPWRARTAAVALAVYSAGLGLVGLAALLETAGETDAALSVVSGRFARATGYPNAEAALYVGGFWGALALASRREVPWIARAGLLATAGLLVQLALLPQSRGALIVLPIAVAIHLALAPGRIRTLVALALVGGATLAASGPVLDVFTATQAGEDAGSALADALDAMLISFLALLVAGALAAQAEGRLAPRERPISISRRLRAAAAAGTSAAALVVVIVVIGNPFTWAEDRWDEFKSGDVASELETSRLTGDLGSNRYDYWRVAIREQFAASPLTGRGADNFAAAYLQNRRSSDEPLYPHSLPVRVLAGTGVVGLALLLAFLLSAIAASWRGGLRADPLPRAIGAAALSAVVYLILHSSADWLWSFPAVSAPAFAWLAIAARLQRPAEQTSGPGLPPRSMAAAASALVLILAASASLILPWAAARDVEIAARSWPSDPGAAYARLDRARGLNPLSSRPDLIAGTIAARRGEADRSRLYFEQALERDSANWYALVQLAALDGTRGDQRQAAALLRRAQHLNPTEPLIDVGLDGLRNGEPLTQREIQRTLLARVCALIGETSDTRYCR